MFLAEQDERGLMKRSKKKKIIAVKPLNSYKLEAHCAITIWIDEVSKYSELDVFTPRVMRSVLPGVSSVSIFLQLFMLCLRSFDDQIIVVHNDVNIFRFVKKLHNRVVFHAHNDYSQEFIARKIDKSPSAVVCSTFLKVQYSGIFQNIEVVPNGVELAQINLRSERYYDLGFVGRFDRNKNFSGFLKFCESLKESQSILVVGLSFDELDEAIRAKMSKSIHIYNVMGVISHEFTLSLLKRTKVLWHFPLLDEAFGMVVLEAYSCGCKLLVREFKGLAFLLKELQVKGYQLCDEGLFDEYYLLRKQPVTHPIVPEKFTWSSIAGTYMQKLNGFS